MMRNGFVVLAIFLGFLFVGCTGVIYETNTLVKFNDDGSGTAKIIFTANSAYASEIQSQLSSTFASKRNFNMQTAHISSSEDQYTITYDLTKPSDLTAFSRFTKTADQTYGVLYAYDDIISFQALTGSTQSFSNFEYCVKMPGVAINKVLFNANEYGQYYGRDTACVTVDGSSSNHGQSLFIQSIQSMVEKKKGCVYDNPACDDRHECLNNTCALKKGCDYDNPPCSDNYDCKANQCVLKPGCKYNNPPCGSNYTCTNNTCVLKPGCLYGNPACDDSHNCLNNTCVLKVGCKYDNPKCSDYERCNAGKNECEIHPNVICGSIFFIGLAVVGIVGYLILRKYLNSSKKLKKKKEVTG